LFVNTNPYPPLLFLEDGKPFGLFFFPPLFFCSCCAPIVFFRFHPQHSFCEPPQSVAPSFSWGGGTSHSLISWAGGERHFFSCNWFRLWFRKCVSPLFSFFRTGTFGPPLFNQFFCSEARTPQRRRRSVNATSFFPPPPFFSVSAHHPPLRLLPEPQKPPPPGGTPSVTHPFFYLLRFPWVPVSFYPPHSFFEIPWGRLPAPVSHSLPFLALPQQSPVSPTNRRNPSWDGFLWGHNHFFLLFALFFSFLLAFPVSLFFDVKAPPPPPKENLSALFFPPPPFFCTNTNQVCQPRISHWAWKC